MRRRTWPDADLSEGYLGPKFHSSITTIRRVNGRNSPEVGGADVSVGIIEVRSIGNAECLRAQLQSRSLSKVKAAKHSSIEVKKAGTAERISRHITQNTIRAYRTAGGWVAGNDWAEG